MLAPYSTRSVFDRPQVCSFRRRELMPVQNDTLWQLQSGAVRVHTVTENGKGITLGLWGAGDIVGQPLVCNEPCLIECLANVNATVLAASQRANLQSALLAHLHQMQELLEIRQGRMQDRLESLLNLLARKFGHPTEHGLLIQHRLTHHDMAETVGTTRVTVTRLFQDLEQAGVIAYSPKNHLILRYCLRPAN
jgi:CRP-like cAMP-binding protein